MRRKLRHYHYLVSKACRDENEKPAGHIDFVDTESDGDVQSAAEKAAASARSKARKKKLDDEKSWDEGVRKAKGYARATMDNSHLHKSFEAINYVLPMLKHLKNIAELPFEHVHQPLKREILRCAARNPHIAVIVAAGGNFWIALISCTWAAVLEGEDDSLRTMVRLLLGEEEYVFCCDNGVTAEMKSRIRNIVGLDEFVPRYLRENGLSLVGESEESKSLTFLPWKPATNAHGLMYATGDSASLVSQKDQDLVLTVSTVPGGFHFNWLETVVRGDSRARKSAVEGEAKACFQTTLELGSVIIVHSKELVALDSGTGDSAASAAGKDVDGKRADNYAVMWVKGLCLMARPKPEIGPVELPGVAVVLSECVYMDGEEGPFWGSIDYQRPLVGNRGEGSKAVAIIPRLCSYGTQFRRVAVLPRCEVPVGEKLCSMIYNYGPSSEGEHMLTHAKTCGVLGGGSFYISDQFT